MLKKVSVLLVLAALWLGVTSNKAQAYAYYSYYGYVYTYNAEGFIRSADSGRELHQPGPEHFG
jgi:hypothetical protein